MLTTTSFTEREVQDQLLLQMRRSAADPGTLRPLVSQNLEVLDEAFLERLATADVELAQKVRDFKRDVETAQADLNRQIGIMQGLLMLFLSEDGTVALPLAEDKQESLREAVRGGLQGMSSDAFLNTVMLYMALAAED
jgi:hypothetical protein